MKHFSRLVLSLFFLGTLAFGAETKLPLTTPQRKFLENYILVQRALAADNLNATKNPAAEIAGLDLEGATSARLVSSALSLAEARDAFKTLSKSALKIASGQPGYFHAHCPMVPNHEGDWVQTNKKIANPYFGKAMLTCGSIEDKS